MVSPKPSWRLECSRIAAAAGIFLIGAVLFAGRFSFGHAQGGRQLPIDMNAVIEVPAASLKAVSPDRRGFIVDPRETSTLGLVSRDKLQWRDVLKTAALGEVDVQFPVNWASYFPDGRRVVYKSAEVSERSYIDVLDLASRKTEQCASGLNAHRIINAVPISATEMVAVVADPGGSGDALSSSVARLSATDCRVVAFAMGEPPHGETWVVSPDRRLVSYVVQIGRGRERRWGLVLQRTRDLTVAHRFEVPLPEAFVLSRFSEDSKQVAALISYGLLRWMEYKLRFYSVESGELLRELTITDPSSAPLAGGPTRTLALSPDGHTVAIGWLDDRKESKRQYALISLYDTATGEEVGRKELASASRLDPRHFVLQFAGDGEYLISSFQLKDVRVWKLIDRRKQ
jgi:hypothetical protein